jgi:hypothetical protein
LRGVNTIALPDWPSAQTPSKVLWRTVTRCAFLSSNRFFTLPGLFRHAGGL